MRVPLFFLLLVSVALVGCDGVPRLQARERATPDRIAFVGEEGDLYTVRPDGRDLVRLTRVGEQAEDGRRSVHFWPSWSPDARRIAAVRADVQDGRGTGTALYVLPSSGGEAARLAGDATLHPFFHSWAPDGRSLALISQEGRTLTLRTVSIAGAVGQPLVDGSQIYFDWAADGRSMATHVDGDAADAPAARVGLLAAEGRASPAPLAVRPNGFRTPALVAGGRAILASAFDSTGHSLVQSWPLDGAPPTTLLTTEGVPAFVASPRGDRIAVTEESGFTPGLLSGIRIVDVPTGRATNAFDGPILAFFWSPAGDRIAWLAVDLDGTELIWFVGDGRGPATRLATFRPSAALATTLPFFDQFAATVDVWSPDGRSLVFTGWIEAMDDGPSQVWVLDAQAGAAPRPIATGQVASWAPGRARPVPVKS